jgi:hypothetical protein
VGALLLIYSALCLLNKECKLDQAISILLNIPAFAQAIIQANRTDRSRRKDDLVKKEDFNKGGPLRSAR